MNVRLARYYVAALFTLVFALMLRPTLAGQTFRLPDQLIEMQIEQRLFETGMADVGVQLHEGTVALSGSVGSLWLKDEAVQEAREVHDVVAVVNTLTVARAASDQVLAHAVTNALSSCSLLTIFDDVTVQVADGVATLTGFVTVSEKSSEYVNVASRTPGVQQVINRIDTLPASMMDDDLRLEIGIGISESPVFARYTNLRAGPVHVIIRDGRVRLTGVVGSEVERRTAELIARNAMGTWSVDNQLRVEK